MVTTPAGIPAKGSTANAQQDPIITGGQPVNAPKRTLSAREGHTTPSKDGSMNWQAHHAHSANEPCLISTTHLPNIWSPEQEACNIHGIHPSTVDPITF